MFTSDLPMTKEAAAKTRYGIYGGNPKGDRFDHARCAYEVSSSVRGILPCQCRRKPGAGPDRLYCPSHARVMTPTPPTVVQEQLSRAEEWRRMIVEAPTQALQLLAVVALIDDVHCRARNAAEKTIQDALQSVGRLKPE